MEVSKDVRDPARALQEGVWPDDPALWVDVEQLSTPFTPIPIDPAPLAVEALPTVVDVIEEMLSLPPEAWCETHPPSPLPLEPPDCVD